VTFLDNRPAASESEQALARQHHYAEQIRDCQDRYRQETGFSRRYAIQTYGCQLNENDSEHLAGLLDEMGFIPAPSPREADLIILNTCSIRKNADDRLFGNLGQIKNLRRDRPDLIIAVCGCMMKQSEHVDRIDRSYSFVDLIFGPQDIYRLPEFLYGRLIEEKRVYAVSDEDLIIEGLPIHRARRFRALVSIMFGCNNFCTYCVVPYTRGRERSRSGQEILGELKQLADEGYKEVMLLGQNVNSYGQDFPAGAEAPADFAQLLAAAAGLQSFSRIRFMTSHPKDISDQLLRVMAENPSIERHLHLPLQSGSDRILDLMNRHYTQAHYLDIAAKARALIPGLTLSTDLIVGFPSETEEDFQETLNVMQSVRFDSAFTFQFSPRTGTPAAKMADQIPADIVSERFQRLVDLQNNHSLTSNQRVVGSVELLLIEGSSSTDDMVLTGRTADNRLVNFTVPDLSGLPADLLREDGQLNGEALEGRMARVRLTNARTFSLTGIMETLEK
jgi:tRNA-2-methylthio-N6-dimethylallyladenosine synthase